MMRKEFFNHEEKGFFKTQKREPVMKNPMTGNANNQCEFPNLWASWPAAQLVNFEPRKYNYQV